MSARIGTFRRRTWPAAMAVFFLALAGCGSQAPSSVKIDASLETLVPGDTTLMAGARLESLLKTPLYQRNFAKRQLPQVEEFAQRTGIDPRKDLWELLYASNGGAGVLLARGKFGDEMMEPNFERQGVARSSYKGFPLYGDGRQAVALFSPTVAAAGAVEALRRLIDERGHSAGPPAALAAKLKQIPATAQFWAAYAGGPIHLPFEDGTPLGNLNKLVASVQSGFFSFDLNSGLNGLARADCATDQDAEQVAGAVRALIGIGRLSVPKDHPELAAIYDTIRVSAEQQRVNLSIAVPEAMVDPFLAMWLRP